MKTTISQQELIASRFADTQRVDPIVGPQSQISIAKVGSVDQASRAWRITLGRLDRRDQNAPLVAGDAYASSPLFPPTSYSYAAGFQNTPAVPPRRSNPVFSALSPGNSSDIEPVFVQILWGMAQGKQNRLIAHWPAQGASIVIEASFVEVFGGVAVLSKGVPPIEDDSFPVLGAQIVPDDGLASEDAGELSIQQLINVLPAAGSVLGVAFQTDGVAHPASGWDSQGASPPQAAMPISAVYNTAPFSGWDARIQWRNPFKRTGRIAILTDNSASAFALADNAVPVAGVFVPSPGDVGIIYTTDGITGVKTVTDFETLVNTSSLISVVSPSLNPAFTVWAGFTTLALYTPETSGTAEAVFLAGRTQGGAVYVPDFARRVRVDLVQLQTTFAGLEYRVPLTGPPACQLVWYDDQGRVVDAHFQGVVTAAFVLAPVVWHPVPARAVMLAVYGDPVVEQSAVIHWRLAP